MIAMAKIRDTNLIERLPAVRGRLSSAAPLAGVTWFRVGGPAEVLFRPANQEDLAAFLAAKPADVPVTVLGVASNLLIRDGGVAGVVLRLGRGFTDIQAEGEDIVCGAAALDLNVAKVARNAGLAGLEFLFGVPGTIGGAVRMNAGAYGCEIKDVLIEARFLDAAGAEQVLTASELGFDYRHSDWPTDWICIGARLRGTPDDSAAIGGRMTAIQAQRAGSQPIRSRTGGSTFKNPTGPEAQGAKAWQLIDRAGCRGLTMGQAMVSEQHCNFLINLGTASAADLERLGEEVRRRVKETSGVTLEWEIKRIGTFAETAIEEAGQ